MKKKSYILLRTSYFLLGFLLFDLHFPTTVFAEEITSQKPEPSSEALAMIAQRMQSLSSSLGGMPQPPNLDKTIKIPNVDFSTKNKTKENL